MSALCERYGVTRSGYYARRGRKPSAHTRGDQRLLVHIRGIFEASEGTYGSPRVHAVPTTTTP